MKYCISGRQSKKILAKADEIKVNAKDYEILFEYEELFPDKTFILDLAYEDLSFIKPQLIETLMEKNNIIFCVYDSDLMKVMSSKNIKWYYGYPIHSWVDLYDLIQLNPAYLFLGEPLSFSLEKVSKKTNIPLRLCPNKCSNSLIPRKNGFYGDWIRPEDVTTYEKWITTLEFYYNTLNQESELLNIYKEKKTWLGNLNLLFSDFNYNVDNRGILEDIGEKRANCGQKCMETGNCHFCETAMILSNDFRKLHFKENTLTEHPRKKD